jgi:hypothetical protein
MVVCEGGLGNVSGGIKWWGWRSSGLFDAIEGEIDDLPFLTDFHKGEVVIAELSAGTGCEFPVDDNAGEFGFEGDGGLNGNFDGSEDSHAVICGLCGYEGIFELGCDVAAIDFLDDGIFGEAVGVIAHALVGPGFEVIANKFFDGVSFGIWGGG